MYQSPAQGMGGSNVHILGVEMAIGFQLRQLTQAC